MNTTKFDQLMAEISACRQCRADFGFEPNPIIFGEQKVKIVQISQAPSQNVNTIGKPFTDLSGKKLKYEWYQLTDAEFYQPDNFYIGAMAHCYPGKNKNGGDNKPPKRCAKLWLEKELTLLENEIYVIIGSYVAKYFFPKAKLTDLVFQDQTINGKLAYVLPHPSPLNIRWFKQHPNFEATRIKQIRTTIHELIR